MNFLRRFMMGRYGMDQLGLVNMALYLVFYFVSLITRMGGFYIVALVLVVIAFFRALSRNIPARQRENAWLLKVTAPARSWLRTRRMIRNDKTHRYFKCPNCGQQLRVPRVNGKIRVTCRSCGTSFEKTC